MSGGQSVVLRCDKKMKLRQFSGYRLGDNTVEVEVSDGLPGV